MLHTLFTQWMAAATSAERQALAAAAGTSPNYLYQIASGRREVSAAMAAVIEKAAYPISKLSKKRLPRVKREDLCKACSECPYRPGCRGKKKGELND